MRILALLIFFLFGLSRPVFAALSLSVDSLPTTIDFNQEFIGNVSLSCANCSDSYLRGVFFEGDSTSYFGFTQNNNGDWVNASNPKTIYYHLDPIESSWSGQLKFKFDPEKTPGNYQFKVIRYTPSGSKSGETSEYTISVSAPPTPTASSTPTATPTTAASPTATPIPTPTVTPTPTKTPASTPTPTKTPTTKPSPSPPSDIKRSDLLTPTASVASEILGASVSAAPSQEVVTPAVEVQTIEKDFRQTDTFTAIAVGVTSLGLLGIIFYRLSKISKNSKM